MTSSARHRDERPDREPAVVFGVRARLIVLAVAVLFVLWLARGVMGPFVIAAVLAYAFSPVVSAVEERTGAPRPLVVAVGYFIVLLAAAVLGFLVAERAARELAHISSGGHDVIGEAMAKIFGRTIEIAGMTYKVSDISNALRDAILALFQTPSSAVQLAERGVDLALQTVLTLILTFYMLLDGHRFRDFTLRFLEPDRRADAERILGHIHVVLGRWLRGQLFLIALVSTVLYLILGPVLGVHYALGLSVFSGVLEIIPIVGPLIAVAVAATVAFGTRGPDTAIIVIVVYTVLRQIEDQVVMPLVIGRAVHLHPVITIFAVLVGLNVWGVLGGLLGVPVAAALNVTLHELYPDETDPLPRPEAMGRPSWLRLPWRRRPRGDPAEPDPVEAEPAEPSPTKPTAEPRSARGRSGRARASSRRPSRAP